MTRFVSDSRWLIVWAVASIAVFGAVVFFGGGSSFWWVGLEACVIALSAIFGVICARSVSNVRLNHLLEGATSRRAVRAFSQEAGFPAWLVFVVVIGLFLGIMFMHAIFLAI